MGVGVGIILIAVGAVLTFAVHVTASAVDIHTIGIILLAVGGAAVVLSLIFWSSWMGPGYGRGRPGPPPSPYGGGPPSQY